MALLGLDFDDITDPIVEAIGEGAYEIGGGDWKYGQSRTEVDVKQLFRLPVPLPDLSDALALFEEYLGWIPLDGLRQFRNLLPDVTDADFSDVPTAVATIINGLTDKPLNTDTPGLPARGRDRDRRCHRRGSRKSSSVTCGTSWG